MPAVPEWLVPLLQQFPIIGLVFGVVLAVVRWVDVQHRKDKAQLRDDLADDRRRLDAEAERVRADATAAQRLVRELLDERNRADRRRLTDCRRRVRELERKLDEEG